MLRRLLTVAALVLAGGTTAVVAATHADAATGVICDQFGSTRQGDYIVQNNRWGTTAQHCIDVTENGFRIVTQDGVSNVGAPVAYPSIFAGCHYTNCSSGFPSPRQISGISTVPSSIDYTFVGGARYNASYDIWLDPTPRTNGVNRTEIMIWLNRQGGVQPVGAVRGNVTLAGRTWEVWTGNNGGNDVVSYVAPAPVPTISFDLKPFIQDTITRGFGADAWYLTSIQAGFEPWSGGVGLAVNSFSARVN